MRDRVKRWFVFVHMAMALCVVPAAAQDVVVRTSVDRTAVWVGDPLHYTVRIMLAPGFDVLDDDMAPEKLKLDGLEFVNIEMLRDAGAGEATMRTFRYRLTTYKVEQRALRIGEIAVRYYRVRPGQGIENAAPAGEVKVPGTSVAFRSMLPDEQETYMLRTDRPATERSRVFAAAEQVGTGLVVASIAPALFWAVALVRKRQPRTKRRSVRQVRHQERTSLKAVGDLDVNSVEGRREAYTKINALVRDHLRDVLGVPGPSLATPEIEPALSSRAMRVPAETVRALLAECDAARYAPPDQLPSADACRAAMDEAARVLAAR